ncbi:MAG: aspartate carbamoyltransferase [Halobacteriales archaeon]|nr:aspartate carbamoyltransferase [Halobacteriales archaeon]
MAQQGLRGKSLVHIQDLSLPDIEHVLDVADKMVPAAEGKQRVTSAQGRLLATLFFEPSTRTRLSFEAAMARLGGQSLGFSEPKTSSAAKGETLADTVRVTSQYADVIVVRHPQEGAARLAQRFSRVPVINAGDGAGQHPTQTLLDLFTIRREKGPIGQQRVALVGDLKYGRTVHSLAQGLARFGTEMVLVAPPTLQMPRDQVEDLKHAGARVTLATRLEEVVGSADVLYVTRIQKERFPDLEEYRKVAGTYTVDAELLAQAKRSAIVLHPLPRVGEIDPEVDSTQHAKYFQQAFYGVPVRMAILSLILGLGE